MPAAKITVIGKPECHLCDVAMEGIESVLAELGPSVEVEVEKLSILDDPALHEQYWEFIPVILVDGVKHAHWRINPATLRAAILEA